MSMTSWASSPFAPSASLRYAFHSSSEYVRKGSGRSLVAVAKSIVRMVRYRLRYLQALRGERSKAAVRRACNYRVS